MCGRYSNNGEFSNIKVMFGAKDELFREWTPAFNIAPSHGPGYEQVIVVPSAEGRVARLARWWLIPGWWNKPLKQLPTAFNARAEDITEKPMFRDAFARSRCLVPATGWREYTGPAGHKQPHHFHFGHQLFAFAGLWSKWTSPEGEAIESFTIITTEPGEKSAAVHDRTPLTLLPEHYDAWLSRDAEPLEILEIAQKQHLGLPVEIYESDPLGNSTRFEGPEVIRPLRAQPGLF